MTAIAFGCWRHIGGLVAGALYLGIVRGDALMLDLSAFSKFMICF